MKQFYFSSGNSFLLAISFFLSILILVKYYLSLRRRNFRNWGIPFVLRTIILVFALILIAQPKILHYVKKETPQNVAVLIDTSQSMLLEAGDRRTALSEQSIKIPRAGKQQDLSLLQSLSRIMQVKEILTNVEKAKNTKYFKFLSFSDALKELPQAASGKQQYGKFQISNFKFQFSDNVKPIGRFTAIGDAISNLFSLPQEKFSAVLLISDGANNFGSPPLEAAKLCRDKHIPIFTIGVGKTSREKNLIVKKIIVDDTVYVDKTIELKAIIEAHLPQKFSAVTVRLRVNDKLQQQKKIKISKSPNHQITKLPNYHQPVITSSGFTVPFAYKPQKTGITRLSVEVLPSPYSDEISQGDNSKTVYIDVLKSKKSIFYIDTLRWEFKYLKRYLDLDNEVHKTYVIVGNDGQIVWTNSTNESLQLKNKNSIFQITNLAGYDVLILGAISKIFTSSIHYSVNTHQKSGRPVVFLGGANSLLASDDKSLEDILPLKLSGRKGENTKSGAFYPLITKSGNEDSMMLLAESQEKNLELWHSLPYTYTFNILKNLNPKMKILAVHPWEKGINGNLPLISIGRFNNSESVLIAFEGLWRWALSPDGSKIYKKFWDNFLHNVLLSLPKAKEQANIVLEKRIFDYGEQIQFYVNMSDTINEAQRHKGTKAQSSSIDSKPSTINHFQNTEHRTQNTNSVGSEQSAPVEDALASVVGRYQLPNYHQPSTIKFINITKNGKIIKKIYLKNAKNNNSLLYGIFQPDIPGNYTASLPSTNNLLEPFSVAIVENELQNVYQDDVLLKNIARVSKGKYFNASSYEKMDISALTTDVLKEFYRLRSYKRELVESSLWEFPWLYFLIVFMLSAEWIIKRRGGLT